MGIDGIFLYKIKNEIQDELSNTRVDKIHQPSKEELVLLFRKAGASRKMFICIRPSSPRIHFTEIGSENPAEPPMFCMLMRKHLSGAKFLQVEDTGFERVVTLVFSCLNEMGDSVTFKLITELIGKQTNVILVGNDGRIVDSLRRSDIESGSRLIQPGAVYKYPEKQEKVNLLTTDSAKISELICNETAPLSKAILGVLDGVSPLISREIAVVSGLDTDAIASDLNESERNRLTNGIESFKLKIKNGKPTALIDNNGIPFEFSYTEITQYGGSAVKNEYTSYSELLDSVFAERDRKERIKSFASDLVKFLSNLRARTEKKINIRENEKKRCADGDTFRIFGELLKSVPKGDERGLPFAEVMNYYDPEFKMVRIPLDTSLSITQNAQRYFKEYKKCCNAAAVLDELIASSRDELGYIESVIDELTRATSLADLKEIRNELVQAGYLRATVNDRKRQVTTVSKPIETVSPDGFRVLIGRNNRQNDELTLRVADKNDIWFHTKNIPGSHVIVCSEGKELPESTVLFAATLAAEHSKANGSSSVPVDYTPVKFVKKPAGAKPGMVIYKTNRTVYVTPERKEL